MVVRSLFSSVLLLPPLVVEGRCVLSVKLGVEICEGEGGSIELEKLDDETYFHDGTKDVWQYRRKQALFSNDAGQR